MLRKIPAAAFSLLTVFLLLLTACGPDTDEAREFDTTIQQQQKAVVSRMLRLAEAAATGDYDSLPQIQNELVAVSSAAVDTVSSLQGPEGSAPYQKAAVELFTFYRETAGGRFSEMIELVQKGDFISENEQRRLNELNVLISKEEAVLDDAYLGARRRFLTRYELAAADTISAR